MLRAPNEVELKKAIGLNYRHEIAGLWVVSRGAKATARVLGPFPGEGGLETLAVAGHHKFLSDAHLFDEAKFPNRIEWEPDEVSAVTAAQFLAEEMFLQQGWKLRLARLQRNDVIFVRNQGNKWNFPYRHLLSVKDEVIRKVDGSRLRARTFRELFTLLKGLLMTADWMASGSPGEDPFLDVIKGVVRISAECLPQHMHRRIEERRRNNPDLPPFQGFTQFQHACSEAEGHTLALAPTGSGKTEAALAWALNQVERGHARKILFLLPTMVTANSIHKRLTSFFGEHGHNVGLVHSTADLIRDSRGDEESEADRADVRAEVLRESHLFLPITVGTVDQLLVPLFHAGRWALKSFAAADSAIIIDEIHAYEPHTLGLIVCMIGQLRTLGARFFAMSATMPTDLRNALQSCLAGPGGEGSSVSIIEENSLLGDARNEWRVCETPLSDWLLDDAGTNRQRPSRRFLDFWGQRQSHGESSKPICVLIVVNTVQHCQALAEALREFRPVCYHSKFIFKDRRKKEQLIDERKPRLLIATQVVEVSLDIDYDVLFTECAPMDALVQRAGRVNRTRRKEPGRVIVHRHEEKSERVYRHPAGILDRTWSLLGENQGLLTESNLLALVDKAYRDLSLERDDAFLRIQSTIRDHQTALAGVLDAPHPWEDDAILKTRIEDYAQRSVIPDVFAQRVLALPPRKRRLYELKMPLWYVRKYSHESEGIPLCEMEYSSKYGGRFFGVPGHPEPACEVI